MKNQLLSGAILIVLLASFSAQAQTSPRAATNPVGKSSNAQSDARLPKNTNAMSSATVDGSDGSATNDGASGQSGRPAPLPVISSGQAATKSSRKLKSSAGKMNHKPISSGSKQ